MDRRVGRPTSKTEQWTGDVKVNEIIGDMMRRLSSDGGWIAKEAIGRKQGGDTPPITQSSDKSSILTARTIQNLRSTSHRTRYDGRKRSKKLGKAYITLASPQGGSAGGYGRAKANQHKRCKRCPVAAKF